MFPADSPEGRAFRRARNINFDEVHDRADRAADEAAYGLDLPVEREAWLVRLAELGQQGRDRDGAAWRKAYDLTYVRECFPQKHIAEWFREAGAEDSAGAAERTAAEVALACQLYRDERFAEGLPWKASPETAVADGASASVRARQHKASGLGNRELRQAVRHASASARHLAKALDTLRREALRPGQAGTSRGARVRGLYTGLIATMLAEAARAQRLEAAASETLELLAARIEVNGDRYGSAWLPWEAAFAGTARWLEQRANDDHFWKTLSSAHGGVTGARDRLIGRLGSLFERGIGVEPTCTGLPNRSPFLRFMAAAQGHMAGLVYARLTDPDLARRSVEAQDLDQVFSAPIYRAALMAHKLNSGVGQEFSSIA